MKQRNVVIEIWRLIFSFLIAIYHTKYLPWYSQDVQLTNSASIGVEFFFILSGYLMAQSAYGPVPDDLWADVRGFISRKLKVIYPTYLFALLLGVCIELLLPCVATGIDPLGYVWYLWDILLLRASGLRGASIKHAVAGSWYLTAMILAMMLLYPILRRYFNAFQTMVAPLLAAFILGWFSQTYGHCEFPLTFRYGICLGLLRAIAEICVGCICFSAAQWLKGRYRQLGRFATLVEVGAFSCVIAISYFYERSYMDFISIFLIAVGISLSFSGITLTSRLSEKLQLRWAGKFSLALYLTHMVWANMLGRWKMPIPFRSQVWIFLVLSFASAVTCVCTLDFISQIYRVRKEQKRQIRSA